MNLQFRQGDILLVKVNSFALPFLSIKKEQGDGRVVLAYGERTGHAHALSGRFSTALMPFNNRNYIRVKKGAVLFHEEHAPIPLPEGTYEVIKQREWQDTRPQREELTNWDEMAMD